MQLPPVRELLVSPAVAGKLADEAARRMPLWQLTPPQVAGLGLLVHGALFPLRGYMTRADHDAVQTGMRLASGAPFPVPVVLEVSADFAAGVDPGEDIALTSAGEVLAILSVTDKWHPETAANPVLGGPVKALRPLRQGDTPRAQRALGHTRLLACDTTDLDFARPLAEGLGAALLVQSLPAPDGPGAALWLALIRRNHGATHVVSAPDPVLRAHAAAIGVEVIWRDPAAT